MQIRASFSSVYLILFFNIFKNILALGSIFNFLTPCDYPVPADSTFSERCGTNYLHSSYICDADNVVSKSDTDKIDTVLAKYELFAKRRVRVGVAVLSKLHYPPWARIVSFGESENIQQHGDIAQQIRKKSTDAQKENAIDGQDSLPDTSQWSCLRTAYTHFYRYLSPQAHISNNTVVRHYVQTFADTLRLRWFGDECGANILFLVIADRVVDGLPERTPLTHRAQVQLSYGPELMRALRVEYAHSLQNELNIWLNNKDLTFTPAIALILERIAERLLMIAQHHILQQNYPQQKYTILDPLAPAAMRIPVVEHKIPSWAIYTFIGCLGSVGLALGLEWTIVRRKTLSLRGSGGEGGEKHQRSKGDSVQVHLYF